MNDSRITVLQRRSFRMPFAGAAVVALLLSLLTATPARAVATIQPGIAISTEGTGCTLAWIFERVQQGPNGQPVVSVFGSTAAHCVASVGQPVTNASTSERIGQVAFVGNANEEGRDYAFIAIDPANFGAVNPAMAGHPEIPTGLSTSPQQGDLMQFSGWGLGFELTQQTREERVGILNWNGPKEHTIDGIVLFGDSGGPVADIDDNNTAYGIVNTVGAGVNSASLTVVHVGEGGANLSFVLADAADRGFNPGTLCIVGQPCGDAPAA